MAGSVACTECRKSHLKCDLQRPICSRCVSNRASCTYLPSRRGGRRIPRRPEAIADQPLTATTAPSTPSTAGWATATAGVEGNGTDVTNGKIVNGQNLAARMRNFGSPHSPGSVANHRLNAETQSRPFVPEARLVRLYYEFFHQSHPILVPAAYYAGQEYPDYLHQVVRFIGSHHSKVLSGDDFLEPTTRLLERDDRSPTMVQALLLFSVMMSARNSRVEAVSALNRAISLALDLGMNQADFAVRYSNGHNLTAESFRRTWWELFIWEIYLALPDCKVTLRCSEAGALVHLPCEETEYASGMHQTPQKQQTISSFRARLFSQEEDSDNISSTEGQQPQYPCPFSSYCYRIEAFYILARVILLNTLPEAHADLLQSVAIMIVSWGHLLPPSKADIVDGYGNTDEMMFQAQFIVHYASALLHVPRSNLRPRFPSPPSTICPETPVRLSPSLTRHIHDVKAIEASKELSNLLSVHSKHQGYSPSVIPGMVLSGLIQLAAGEAHASGCFEQHQNRVVLVLGTLGILKTQWKTALEAYRHVKAAAAATITTAAGIDTSSATRSTAAVGSGHFQGPFEGLRNLEQNVCADSNVNIEYIENDMDTSVDAYDLEFMDRMFRPGLVSPHIDPACGELVVRNDFADLYSH